MKTHLLGVGGTGMAAMAGLLSERGYAVTGTDEKVYPPMSDMLKSLHIVPFEGYRPENIDKADPALVIVGNVIRRDNPEVQEVMRRELPYTSMPQALSDIFLEHRTPLVVAGTHGKTTTSTLAAWLLEHSGARPGFMIGGVGVNLSKGHAIGKGPFFVVEGDEYDTAFFDKGPKFLHYRAQAVILTSIEFDHADIYRDLNHVMGSFRRLLSILPPDGLLVANIDDENVHKILDIAPCRTVTYGMSEEAEYRPENVVIDSSGTNFQLHACKGKFQLPMWGEHNLLNATAVIAALAESGELVDRLAEGLSLFKGVARRQELVGEKKGVSIIDDFAHHPTAVNKTIESMRVRYPERRLWAIFEPRSNTSRRKVFQREFIDALAGADRVIIADTFKSEAIPSDERLDPDEMASILMKRGTDAHHIGATEHIVEFVMRNVSAGDVILVMSNGGFGGLPRKMLEALDRRQI